MLKFYFELIVDYIKGMWRFRKLGIIAAWVFAIFSCVIVLLIPNQYESKALISVETDSVLGPLLQGLAVSSDTQSRVAVMTETLLSRPNLQKVVNNSPLSENVESEADLESLVVGLRKRIQIDKVAAGRSGENNIYELIFHDKDPHVSFEVINQLIKILVEDTAKNNEGDSINAQEFLLKQITEYEKRLTEAETRLSDFKRNNVGKMPEEGGDYYTNLREAQAQLGAIGAQLSIARRKKQELSRQLVGEEPVFGLAPQEVTQSLSATEAGRELQAYMDKRRQLLLKYTELHPEIQSIDTIIRDLESKHQAQLQVLAASGAINSPLKQNMVYQTMKIAANQADVEVSALQTQYGAQKRKVDNLREQVDSLPEVEAELTRLNRDYEVNKTQYEELVARLETAKLSQSAESRDEGQNFKIIEAPMLPLEPSGPIRSLYLLASFVASILFAIGFMFILNQLKPVFVSANAVMKFSGLPVLGEIGVLNYEKHRSDEVKQIVSVASAIVLLGVLFFCLIHFQESAVMFMQNSTNFK
jgi:polysaccharide chain length determinant protein (PEP-CTERM system associated)